MNKLEKAITQSEIIQLANKAYETAKVQGFYSEDTNINTCLMLIITEMAEVVQADRKDKHGSIADYEKWLGVSEEKAYEESLEGTVESEFADIAIRILSLLGWYNSMHPVNFLEDTEIFDKISLNICTFIHLDADIPKGLHSIICNTIGHDCEYSLSWEVTNMLQNALCRVFALASKLGIDLLLHIKLKMRYNETRDYKHGYKY